MSAWPNIHTIMSKFYGLFKNNIFSSKQLKFCKTIYRVLPQNFRLILFSVKMQIQLETRLLAMDTEYILYVIEDDLLEIRKYKLTVSSGFRSQHDFVFYFTYFLFVCFKVKKTIGKTLCFCTLGFVVLFNEISPCIPSWPETCCVD